MSLRQLSLMVLPFAASIVFCACSRESVTPVERYVSPQIQGASQRINLEEVQKAFSSAKGKDLNSWMAQFEKRVNEIYDGQEVVSIDATRQDGKLNVIGYIDTDKKPGFQSGEEKLFSIEQTGEAANNEMPYRVAGQDGRTYYEGHHSLLDNPFLQMMLIHHMLGGWGGHYYTRPQQVGVLYNNRNSYRQTPQYAQQQASNRGFFSDGGLKSSRQFGQSGFTSAVGEKKRGWGGFSKSPQTYGLSGSTGSSQSSMPSSTGSFWGGRRSSGGGLFSGGFRRSWGSRRR